MSAGRTIAAIATPPGRGAIAIVRASGPEVGALARRVVPAARLRPHYAQHVAILDAEGRAIDRGIALYAQAPRSYTGEDTLELHVHGSPIVASEVLRALLAAGAHLAQPGEFTQRAFMNGKLDLHAAAAVADLIEAETRSAARAAFANLAGGLATEVRVQRAHLAEILEELAAAIDFPDEVPEPARERLEASLEILVRALQRLQRDGEVGRLVREGVNVAIVGPPNAGKSSLLNALLGEERALVSDLAGTTRDTIEESIAIDGVRVRIVDTAGIREHADRLEAAGIERTRRALDSARIALVVIDASQPLAADAAALLERTRERPRVVFANKADLGIAATASLGDVVGSVRERTTLDALRAAIAHVGWGGERPDLERPHIASVREFAAMNDALGALEAARETLARGEASDFIAGDLQAAYAALGHISGDEANEEIVTGVFARFCIGK
ncbi:MAG: tRNA uridine-5-carboxymethylaminomethyl(34) synthesis GTPase MnmE [Vulcanimicrobiaceae bacterium]